MNRSTVLLLSCLAIAGSAWLAHVVLGQTAAETREKTITITRSQFDKYVADAVAAEREKATRGKEKPATDEDVLNPQNWHKAIFNKAEWVVYTGPGTVLFHHWVESAAKPPVMKSGATSATTPKGN
jgi:hypothetical protein